MARPPLDHVRCESTCWKGDPNHSIAKKARCTLLKDHQGDVHLDENGNRFTGTGQTSKVFVVR